MAQIEAFILIGGRSSRLGTDKAFVELGGMTLAERAVANARGGLPDAKITMVAGSSTQFAIEAIAADVPFIFDLYEARGPLGGIHAALSYANAPWIFVMACDYPFVSPEIIKQLEENISSEFGVVLPKQSDGRLQPLCAFYNVERSRPIVEEILLRKRPPPPMHEIVIGLDPLIIAFDNGSEVSEIKDPFLNINTLKDLELAEKTGTERADKRRS